MKYYDVELTKSQKHLAAAMKVLLLEGVKLESTYENDWGFVQPHKHEVILRISLAPSQPRQKPSATLQNIKKCYEKGMTVLVAETIIAS